MIFPALLIITLAAFAILSWRNQKLGIILLFALLPTYLVRFSIGPIPSTLLEGLVLITIVKAVISSISLPLTKGELEGVWRSFGWYRVPIVLVVIAGIVSTIIAPDTFSALGILKAYIIEPVLLAFVIKAAMTDRDDIEKIVTALITSATVVGTLAIFQILTHIGIPDAWTIENRATSLYDYPNAVGLFIAPVVTVAIVRYASSMKKLDRSLLQPIPIISILLMLGGIVSAKTEAALVAIPAALVIIGLLAPIAGRIKYGIIAATITGACAVSLFAPSIMQKIVLHDSSGLVRRAQWSETLTMLADRPFLGAGLNGYPTALVPYHDATFYEIFQYPHNIFLNVWSEMGLVGLIGLMTCAFLVARTTWRRRDDALVLAFSAAILTMAIHGLVDVPLFKNDLAIFAAFCVMGMLVKKETKI
ncbi:MAG: O-antigen ligase family protein [Patescibacteria group bacterium]